MGRQQVTVFTAVAALANESELGEEAEHLAHHQQPAGLAGGIDGGPAALALEGVGEDVGREPVAALGQRNRELRLRPPVHPGRPPCARPATIVEPPVVAGKQSGICQTIEVERRQGAGHADGGGGFLAAHRAALVDDPIVETTTGRLVEERDRAQLIHEVDKSITSVYYRKS